MSKQVEKIKELIAKREQARLGGDEFRHKVAYTYLFFYLSA